MEIKPDFLTQLRRQNFHNGSLGADGPADIRILLQPTSFGIELSVVDRQLNNVDTDWENYTGALGRLVKAFNSINKTDTLSFDWTGDNREGTVMVADFPYLVPLFIECHEFLIDSKGKEIKVDMEGCYRTEFVIEDDDDSSGKDVPNPAKSAKGVFYADGARVKGFLSDEYVLTDDGIKRIETVGDNYADLMAFTEPFGYDMLESFLSIFFSTAANVDLRYGDRKVYVHKTPVRSVPTLVFEKVDADDSLHMRVLATLGNLPSGLTENFKISTVVTVSEKTVDVRPAEVGSDEPEMKKVYDIISRNAPSRAAMKEVWKSGDMIIVPPEVASPFLLNGLPVLLSEFRLMGAEKLKAYNITAVTPKLSLRLGSGIDFLEGSAEVEVGNQTFSINDLLRQYSDRHYVTLHDGGKAVLDEAYMKRLQRLFRNKKGKDDKVRISFFDLPEVMDLLDGKDREQSAFKGCRDFYEGFSSLRKENITVTGLKAKLRDYQKEGVKWINYLYENNMGGCLADDMGLGKTVQTIGMLCRSVKKAEAPSVVVMPRSLLFNWEEEFRKFAPNISVSTYYGTNRNLDEALKAQVVLTSYAVVRNDIERLSKVEFDYVILDESQNIKNAEALTTKAVWLLKGKHRLAISGTPIENNLMELYSLFRFLNPSMFGSQRDFNEKYLVPVQRDGDQEVAEALRRKIFPFVLRRLKKDVLKDLPERMEQTIMVEMSERQAEFYEARRRYYAGEVMAAMNEGGVDKARFEILRALNELRQIASIPEEKTDGAISSPKVEILVENVLQAIENGHKVVVFYNFLGGIDLTGERLSRAGIGYEVMTGATSNRQKVVENFKNNPDCKVMLMTVKTGGVGLNLVNADTVFIFEPWWNKAAESQAINRLHRIGQKNAVNCYFMVTEATIEEKIRQLQEQKSALIDAIISSDSAGGKTLSADEINYLLS